jgi:long-chain fatty acid transport protein
MKMFFQNTLGLLLACSMVSNSFAVGAAFIGNEAPSARAAGQGYVGVAGQNEDPTAVFTNPGAITSLKGTQLTLGGTWENVHGSYKDDAGNQTKERVISAVVPNFSMTQNFASILDGKFSAGFSSQNPFGLQTNWDGNSPMRYVATNSKLGMVDVTPVIAYQVHPMFSVGIGADYDNIFDAQLDKHINNDFANYVVSRPPPSGFGLGSPTSGSPDGIASLRGTGAGWGYHAGFVFKPTEQHSVGLTYHSKVDVRVNGSETITGITGAGTQAIFGGSTFSTSVYTDVVFPESVQMGYAFKPNDRWHIEMDAAWYHWSSAEDLNVRFPAATTAQKALLGNMRGTTNITPLNLHDAWSLVSGVNYKANNHWQLRGGVWYEPWAVPEADFSPAFMDQTRYGLTSGVGYSITENLTVDAAYVAIFTHNRTIHNDVGTTSSGIPATGVPGIAPSPDIDGTYSDFANAVQLSMTYRFANAFK